MDIEQQVFRWFGKDNLQSNDKGNGIRLFPVKFPDNAIVIPKETLLDFGEQLCANLNGTDYNKETGFDIQENDLTWNKKRNSWY